MSDEKTKKVYVAICECIAPGECEGPVDILGVFGNEWAARTCIEDLSRDLKGERFYCEERDRISATVKDGTDVQYKYVEYDVKERYVKWTEYMS